MNSGCTYREIVGPRDGGRTLGAHLAGRYTHTSEPLWRERMEGGLLLVDGQAAHPEQLLRAGQEITWERPPWQEPDAPLSFAVLFEDAHLVTVAKPSGLPTLPGGDFQDHTLLALVRRRYPKASPLHRLGRFTSGLVLFARDPASRAPLHACFQERRVDKVYRALVEGRPPCSPFVVETPIGPVPFPSLGNLHAASPEGRASHSEAWVIETRECQSLLEVRIRTGRPHQIRIHMAACGHPLVDDPLYGPGGTPRTGTRALPGDGGYHLHAHRLALVHPWTGETLRLECQAPPLLRAGSDPKPGSAKQNG